MDERIFLCHSSEDKEQVRDLHRRLRQDGLQPWLDEEDILPGQDWESEIRHAIRESRYVLACLSKNSVTKRGYVQKEIKQALDAADERPDGSIFLIPVRLEPCRVPDRLRNWQWADLFAAGGYERLLFSLGGGGAKSGVLPITSRDQGYPTTVQTTTSRQHPGFGPPSLGREQPSGRAGLAVEVRKATDLQLVLGDAERWLGTMPSLAGTDLGLPPTAGKDLEAVRGLQTRAASSLINIALIGGFSSGKSFLASGLQGGLELTRIPSADGEVSDKFIGFLPSTPKPTTACPASVVPVSLSAQVDASEHGFLRARFSDTDQWEDIGAALPPVVAAYAMGDDFDVILSRREEHRYRSVAEIEILVSDTLFPVKIYDLPSHRSPNPIHDQIVREAMADADCFIHVSTASTPLVAADLDLIRFLYDHHLYSGKRVVWVVTAIDRAMELGQDNRPAWTATVARNNSYLRENFTLPDGRPDLGFIGEGFIPVSPASEARGKYLIAAGNQEAGRRLLAESRMDALRRTLWAMIGRDTGPRHVAAIASESRALLFPYQRALSERLETERLPVNQLLSQSRGLGDRLRDLTLAVDTTDARLGAILDRRIKSARQAFSGLAPYLREKLESEILAADLRRHRKANQIEVHRTQVIREWMTSSTGPLQIWERELEAFTSDVLTEVRTAVLASHPLGEFRSIQMIDIGELTAPNSQRSNSDAQDVVQRAAAVVGALTPVGAGVAAALGVLGGPLLLIPVGVAAAATLAYVGITYRTGKATSLDLLRREWIAELDEIASEVERLFVAAAGLAGSEIIERAIAILADRRDQLADSLLVVQGRIGQPETATRQDLVARLDHHCRDGEELLARLTQLAQV